MLAGFNETLSSYKVQEECEIKMITETFSIIEFYLVFSPKVEKHDVSEVYNFNQMWKFTESFAMISENLLKINEEQLKIILKSNENTVGFSKRIRFLRLTQV